MAEIVDNFLSKLDYKTDSMRGRFSGLFLGAEEDLYSLVFGPKMGHIRGLAQW